MNILIVLIIGAVAGWLVAAVREVDQGIFAYIALGMLGSFAGSFVPRLMGEANTTYELTWGNFLWCLIGALVLASVLTMITRTNKNSGV